MIKTLLFDMGNVLVYFSHQRMYEQIGAICGRTAPEIAAFFKQSGLFEDFDRGRIVADDLHRGLEQAVGQPVAAEDLRQATCDIFWRNDSLAELLPAFKAAGYRLVLLSNTCQAHVDFIRARFDVLDHFDDFVLSCDIGALKPESAIYAAALARIGCRPDECFYTDDIPKYVETGREFGLHAEVYQNTEHLIATLAEIGVRIV